MPKRTAEIDSDEIDSLFDMILNASSAVDYHSDFKEYLTALKTRVLSHLSFKEETRAATDFTLSEAIYTFGLKYVESFYEYMENHEWDIEKDVGMEEFPTTPCIGETFMPSSMILLNHSIKRD
jgi:hypothetical protein